MNKDELIEFLRGELGVDTSSVEDDTPLFSSGIIDSFSLVSLISFLEKREGIRVGPTEVNLDNLDTIGRILNFLQAKTSGGD